MGIFETVVLLLVVPATSAHVTRPADAKKLSKDALIARARDRDPIAIEELGKRREKGAAEVLKKIAEEPREEYDKSARLGSFESIDRGRDVDLNNQAREQAKIALAQLGDDKYFEPFIVGLSSSVPSWRAYCLSSLAQIGDKRAVKHIAPLLFDSHAPVDSQATPKEHADLPERHSQEGPSKGRPRRVWKRRSTHSDNLSLTYSSRAALALGAILPDVRAAFDAQGKDDGFLHEYAWKKWWAEHHAEYESLK